MHVLIPAYQPTRLLVKLVDDLLRARPSVEILVVDDGSDVATHPVFVACEMRGARVLRLPANRGKGAALRAGFQLLTDVRVTGPVVTADADGQHAVDDILRVADAVDPSGVSPPYLVIGERQFDGQVPLRSRFGNAVTRVLFRAATGKQLTDTQTGLRAFPSDMLSWLTDLTGDRYEYELGMLLAAARQGVEISGVPISTIYLDDNASSHFRPLADSIRIYAPLLMFVSSSLAGFAIDTLALVVLQALFGALLPAVVGARILSGAVNFGLNRRFVFGGVDPNQGRTSAAVRYSALALTLLTVNYLILTALYATGLDLLLAKVLTEVALVAISYLVQAQFVFVHQRIETCQPVGSSTRRHRSASVKPTSLN